jgi:BirA family biotin operon repressor/biotin-[acetyl-CoA-carboxylase] ligase
VSAASAPLFASPAEAARWAAGLPAGALGRAGLRFSPETTSTQDEAFAAAARGAPHGAVFIAERQSAGRGRRGATWSAPAGSSLLFSVLLVPAPPAKHSGRTALAAAVAAARAIDAVGGRQYAVGSDVQVAADRLPPTAYCLPPTEIKWPNDLLLGGRKLGGILVESRRGRAALGIGINVSQRPEDFPPELRARATSLLMGAARQEPSPPAPRSPTAEPIRLTLLSALLAELGRIFATAELPAECWEALRAEVERRLAWRGRSVGVEDCPGGPLVGKLLGLDPEGRLLLETAGRRHAVANGLLGPADPGGGPG